MASFMRSYLSATFLKTEYTEIKEKVQATGDPKKIIHQSNRYK
jgi:hypothetical protein